MSNKISPLSRIASQTKMRLEILAEPGKDDTTLKAYGRFILGMMLFTSVDTRSELTYPNAPKDIIPGGSAQSIAEFEAGQQLPDDDATSSHSRSTSLLTRSMQGIGVLASAGVLGTAIYLGMTATDDKPPATPSLPSPVEQGYSTQQYTPVPESANPTPEYTGATEYQSLLPTTQP